MGNWPGWRRCNNSVSRGLLDSIQEKSDNHSTSPVDKWVDKEITIDIKRTSEIQRLRVCADLLELIGAINEDKVLAKNDISDEIFNVITKNFLYEPLDIYRNRW